MTKEQIKTALDAGECTVTLTSGLAFRLTTKLDLVPEDRRPATLPDGAGSTLITWNNQSKTWMGIKAENVQSVA